MRPSLQTGHPPPRVHEAGDRCVGEILQETEEEWKEKGKHVFSRQSESLTTVEHVFYILYIYFSYHKIKSPAQCHMTVKLLITPETQVRVNSRVIDIGTEVFSLCSTTEHAQFSK